MFTYFVTFKNFNSAVQSCKNMYQSKKLRRSSLGKFYPALRNTLFITDIPTTVFFVNKNAYQHCVALNLILWFNLTATLLLAGGWKYKLIKIQRELERWDKAMKVVWKCIKPNLQRTKSGVVVGREGGVWGEGVKTSKLLRMFWHTFWFWNF